MHVVPVANSSNLLSTIASVTRLWPPTRARYANNAQAGTTPTASYEHGYEWVLLTRFDLHLKQPLTTLPPIALRPLHQRDALSPASLASSASPASSPAASPGRARFFFPFKEASSDWRQARVRGVCFYWVCMWPRLARTTAQNAHTASCTAFVHSSHSVVVCCGRAHRVIQVHGHTVSDVMHVLAAPMLPCLVHALDEYLRRVERVHAPPNSNLHKLYDVLVRRLRVPAREVGFLVDGCYNSNPQGGLRACDIGAQRPSVPRSAHWATNTLTQHTLRCLSRRQPTVRHRAAPPVLQHQCVRDGCRLCRWLLRHAAVLLPALAPSMRRAACSRAQVSPHGPRQCAGLWTTWLAVGWGCLAGRCARH